MILYLDNWQKQCKGMESHDIYAKYSGIIKWSVVQAAVEPALRGTLSFSEMSQNRSQVLCTEF